MYKKRIAAKRMSFFYTHACKIMKSVETNKVPIVETNTKKCRLGWLT